MLDPAAGDGALLRALIECALENGISPRALPIDRLFAYDSERRYIERYKTFVVATLGRTVPRRNARITDFLLEEPGIQADIIFTNPPWLQFCDAPRQDQARLARLFTRYHIIEDLQKALLGSSRADVAALFIARAVAEATKPIAEIHSFLPASLFFGDGASRGFRRYDVGSATYRLTELTDLDGCNVFTGVQASACIAWFAKDASPQKYPIPYIKVSNSMQLEARPYADHVSPLRISPPENRALSQQSGAEILAINKPRQGVNTCGANGILIFQNVRNGCDDEHVIADSEQARDVELPRSLLHPFVFQEQRAEQHRRFVLLCYDRTSGRPLPREDLQLHRGLWDYLEIVRERLVKRRGTLIQASMKPERWWTLLGVGPYCFTPYKIIWKAFGVRHFTPVLVSAADEIRIPQGNQALHAFISFDDEAKALHTLALLRSPSVTSELDSLRSRGVPSFAQPGRIKMILEHLFDVRYLDNAINRRRAT